MLFLIEKNRRLWYYGLVNKYAAGPPQKGNRMANLRVSGVTKVYPSGKTALADISLSSADSEFLAVVGGASSGKSTLLRVIAGLEEPDDGQALHLPRAVRNQLCIASFASEKSQK